MFLSKVIHTSSCARSRRILSCINISKKFSAFHGSTQIQQGSNIKFDEFNLPQRTKQKVVSASDAVELVRSGDTIAVSGFVAQGSPEALLKALGERFDASIKGIPHSLTLLFGGGPGDFQSLGLNHLAKTKRFTTEDSNEEVERCMLLRTIGGHYGQVPLIAELALKNKIEAWTLPMVCFKIGNFVEILQIFNSNNCVLWYDREAFHVCSELKPLTLLDTLQV